MSSISSCTLEKLVLQYLHFFVKTLQNNCVHAKCLEQPVKCWATQVEINIKIKLVKSNLGN